VQCITIIRGRFDKKKCCYLKLTDLPIKQTSELGKVAGAKEEAEGWARARMEEELQPVKLKM